MTNLIYEHLDGTMWEITDEKAFEALFWKENFGTMPRHFNSFDTAKKYGIIHECKPSFVKDK